MKPAILNEPVPPAKIVTIPHAHLEPWADQPRKHFDPADLEELRASIKEHGFLENFPLLVRPKSKLRVREESSTDPAEPPNFCIEEETEGGNWRELDVLHTLEAAEKQKLHLTRFEIIDGERRWMKAGDEKISLVPCVIRELTDSQALELALVSSLQKAGLNPMEIANSYRQLLDFREPDGTPINTAKTIAAKINKTEQHVKDMLLLCNLKGTGAAKAIAAGELGTTLGVILGRLPTHELREEWSKKVLKNPWGPSPMPREQLKLKLETDVMKQLRGADFDPNDPELVPMLEDTGERKLGGACTDCPFNTRNIDADPDDKKSRNHMCLHPACYRAKETANHERWRKEHTNPAKQTYTLPQDENAKLWADSGTALAYNSPYVELDEKPHDTELKPGTKNVAPWKELIKGREVPVIVARDEKGKAHRLVLAGQATAAAVENKHRIFKGGEAAEPAPEQRPAETHAEAVGNAMDREATAEKDREAARALEDQREQVWIAQTGALVESVTTAKRPPEGLFALLYEFFKDFFTDGRGIAAERRGVPHDALEKSIVRGNDASFAAALLEIYLHDDWWANGEAAGREKLKKLAKLYQVDIKAVEKTVLAKIKEEKAAAAEAAEIGDGMVWKNRRESDTDGEEYRFNNAQIAENPERCELSFPKALKMIASVSLAWVHEKKGWVVGWFVQGPKFGTSEPCAANATKYDNRQLALRAGLLSIKAQLKAHPVALKSVDTWIASLGAEKPAAPAKAKKGVKDAAVKKGLAKKKGAKK